MTVGKICTIKFASIIIAGLLFSAIPVRNVSAEDNLTLAIHPYLATDVLEKRFTPIIKYLSKKIGKSINIRIGSNYNEHIQYVGHNNIDIAYMGPVSYIKMTNTFGIKPLLARLEIEGSPWFQGNIITRADSNINSLESLKGKRIAYGDPNSTMSYIVPHHMLHRAGIYTDSSTKYNFLSSHNNVAMGVLAGDFDAGAVKPAVFKKFEAQGLRIIANTPKISEHVFVARDNMTAKEIDILREAFLSMKNSEEGMNALHAIKKSITGLVSANDGDYKNLRKIILDLNMLKQQP